MFFTPLDIVLYDGQYVPVTALFPRIFSIVDGFHTPDFPDSVWIFLSLRILVIPLSE